MHLAGGMGWAQAWGVRNERSIAGFELAREIGVTRGGRTRWRCPADVRQRVVGYARERHTAGWAWKEVAAELGVACSALRLWVKAGGEERPGALVPVSVRGLGVLGSGGSAGVLTLVSPAGYRTLTRMSPSTPGSNR